MGHEVRHYDVKENIDRVAFEKKLDHMVAMDDWQEGASGLPKSIRWIESAGVLDSYDDALDYIEKHDHRAYDQLAVRYNATKDEFKPSAKFLNAKEREKNAREAYKNLTDKINADFFGAKSEYVGCKGCGSKLSRKHLSHPTCPLCKNSLLSETASTRLSRSFDKIKDSKKKADDAWKADEKRRKKGKIGDVRWLVKIEYHK